MMRFPIRLPFGLVLHRTSALADGIYDDLSMEYEAGVLHAEAHVTRVLCDCPNRSARSVAAAALRLQQAYDARVE